MDKKPSDFFLGVFEIFAILLPGGTALLLLLNWNGWRSSGTLIPHSEATAWIVMLIGSYALGHLFAAIGSVLLDPLYDRFYKKAMQADEVLHAEKVPSIARFLRRWKYAVTNSKEYVQKTCLQKCADTYKEAHFRQENEARPKRIDETITNLFWWAGSIVNLRSAAAASEVARLQADSKFFRSLTLVLLVVAALSFQEPWKHLLPKAINDNLFLATAGLALISMWRFMNLRWKSTERTYEYFIAAEKERTAPKARDDHA